MDVQKQILYNDWLNLNIHLFWCYDGKTGQNLATSGQERINTKFSNSGAWLVRKGWAKVEHSGQTTWAKPGQWLIVKPCKRKQTFAPDTEILSISFDARWPDGSLLFDEGLSETIDSDQFPALERKAKPIVKAVKKKSPNTWDLRTCKSSLKEFLYIQSLLCSWLMELSDVLDHKKVSHSGQFDIDQRVMKAVRIIDAHSLGDPLNIDQLASDIGLSTIHLNRLFKKDLNQTPASYYESLRIEHSINRLKIPNSSIKEVSTDLGFTYLSHFSKWFKKRTGKTPREFKA